MNDRTEHSPSDAASTEIHGGSVPSEPPLATAEVPAVGTGLDGSVATAEVPPTTATKGLPPLQPEGIAPPPTGKGRRKLLVLIGAVLAVAIIASIAAVALSGGGKSTAGKASPNAAASPLQLLAPTGVAAASEAFSVTLSWTQPAGGAEVEGYTIYKDGVRVGEVAGTSTTFTDVRVVPGKEYAFEIEARAGGKASDRVLVDAQTPVPPLSAARLSGDFNVKLKPTSQYGFSTRYGRTTLGWNFDPKCAEGACRVVWRDLFFKGFKTTLARKGAAYSGSDGGKFDVTCSGAKATTTMALKFKVTKARALDGEWRAVKLVGTLTQREVAQLGCVSSGVDWTFTASLVT